MNALDRLGEDYLQKVDAEVSEVRRKLEKAEEKLPDQRIVVHCHSYLSHDSEGSIDEIAAAANRTGTAAVIMTDHPRQDLDVMADGFRGKKKGVLFLPGAETKNLLIFLGEGRLDYQLPRERLIEEAKEAGAIVLLSHLEADPSWDGIGPVDGCEIYNTHASFKEEEGLAAALLEGRGGVEQMLKILLALKQHPDSGLGALSRILPHYMAIWDGLCSKSRHCGVAANDSHQNLSIRVRRAGRSVSVIGPEGNHLGRFALTTPSLLPEGRELHFQPDSYEAMFLHVGTHLVCDRTDEEGIRRALTQSRCYVSFDWIAQPKGFAFTWHADRGQGLVGDWVDLSSSPTLAVEVPVESEIVLLRNGQPVARTWGTNLEFQPEREGAYRTEVYQRIAGELRPWVLSNPIYVRRA